jgi:hypothetical protein
MGPLVGFAFTGSVRTYAEASGLNGPAAGVGRRFTADRIWAPTLARASWQLCFCCRLWRFAWWRATGRRRVDWRFASLSPVVRVAVKALVLAGWVIASTGGGGHRLVAQLRWERLRA